MKLTFLKGIPASGKSTWAKEQGTLSISKDTLRLMHPDYDEKRILEYERGLVYEFIEQGHPVIIDNTHFNPIHEEFYSKVASDNGYEFVVKEFRTPLNECIQRNRRRTGTKRVPDSAIYQMAKQSGWYEEELKPFNTDKTKVRVVCVDIDGTVAKMNGRSPYDYSKVSEDLPNEPVVDIVSDVYSLGKNVVFVSGRPDSCENETYEWLTKNVIAFPFGLYMRKTGDKRPDYEIKEEIYREICKDYYVEYVIDDRTQVVARLRALGFTVLQVDDGNF